MVRHMGHTSMTKQRNLVHHVLACQRNLDRQIASSSIGWRVQVRVASLQLEAIITDHQLVRNPNPRYGSARASSSSLFNNLPSPPLPSQSRSSLLRASLQPLYYQYLQQTSKPNKTRPSSFTLRINCASNTTTISSSSPVSFSS